MLGHWLTKQNINVNIFMTSVEISCKSYWSLILFSVKKQKKQYIIVLVLSENHTSHVEKDVDINTVMPKSVNLSIT